MSRGNLCVAPPTRNKPNRHFWTAEDRFANGSKTHVHGQRDLTPSAPGPTLDFGYGYLRHVPEPLADHLRFGEGGEFPKGVSGFLSVGNVLESQTQRC
jgi:hypothetical protein